MYRDSAREVYFLHWSNEIQPQSCYSEQDRWALLYWSTTMSEKVSKNLESLQQSCHSHLNCLIC